MDAPERLLLWTTALISLLTSLHALRLSSSPTSPPPPRPKRALPISILLIRHAESQGNANKEAYQSTPDPLIPLSPEGERQAHALGKELRERIKGKPVWVYCSPYERVRRTTEIGLSYLNEGQVVYVREDPRLREQEFAGGLQTQSSEEDKVRRDAYSRFFFRWPTGESAADVYDRISSFMGKLWRDFATDRFVEAMGDDGVVVIFSHGLTSRLFLMRWLHWKHEEFDRSRNPPNCAILELKREPGDFVFKLTKDTRRILFHDTEHEPKRATSHVFSGKL